MIHPLHVFGRAVSARGGHAVQRGVSLLFALLALAAMSLAAVALVRSVDSGGLVIGNLSFKQDATTAADRATEDARQWLMQAGRDLTADDPSEGYYATSQEGLDPTGRLTSASNRMAVINWGDSDSCALMQPANWSTSLLETSCTTPGRPSWATWPAAQARHLRHGGGRQWVCMS